MHERVDGTGVPHGVSGDAIPIGARILAVANAFETILDGLGRGDVGVDAALDHLRAQRSRAFDARIVDLAVQHVDQRETPERPRAPARMGTHASTSGTVTRLRAA
jgi:HD-GYP domain-containing protein (c-di-GMP phosphodiesterase class II)